MDGKRIERGRLWKERARSLQLQIRSRFRVAVDRHWSRVGGPSLYVFSSSSSSSHYYPPTLQRWIHRARRFLRDPSSSPANSSRSSMFYRKRVAKNIDEIDDSVIIRFLQAVAVPVLGNACHIFMHGLNHIQIYGAEKLHTALLQRPEDKPLLTVSNHVAAIDDPFVIASLLPPSIMLDSRNIRWTLCASDRCFTNPMFSTFFRCVKVLPVSRGEGLYQKGMDMAVSKLNNGGWVHIFPEGSRSRDGGRTVGKAKRGVGRLVMDADKLPIVIPFVHTGMQEIMPVGTHFPNIGKKVTVLVGDPIDFEDLCISADDPNTQVSRGVLYDAVSARISRRLQELKLQVDGLVLEQSLKLQDTYLSNTERANGIWQQVDWEAFGLPGSMLTGEDGTSITSVVSNVACLRSDLHQRPDSTTYTSLKASFSFEGGIVSRIRGHMNPCELMGFAAKGMFMNIRAERPSRFQEVKALKVWKQFVEANLISLMNV